MRSIRLRMDCPANLVYPAYNAAMQAYGWLLTTPGAPLLYYGDEYGEYGGADPDGTCIERKFMEHNGNTTV